MREATQNMAARFQTRLGWWQRTFRIPTLLNSAPFSQASSLWLALMALVGMQHKSPGMRLKKRSTDIHQSKKYRDAKRVLLRRLIHEPLEDRQLLATDVSVVSGNLVVNGDDAVNSWAFATNGGNLTITSSSGDIITSSVSGSGGSGTESVTIPLSAFTGTLGVNGLGGNDTIQVNGLTLSGNRSLSIDGGSGADAVTFQTAATLLSGAGVISVSAETMITKVGGTLTTGIGPISLSVDDVDIQGEIASNTTVAITPAQLNRPISLGTNTIGSLGLTDTELDRVTAGTIQIGDGNAGVITVSGAITRPISTAMNLTNNAAINFSSGSINTLGGNLIFSTPTGISPASSGVEINTGASNQVQLSRNLTINISGTGVDSGYNQLNVVGAVNINDAHLITVGTHIPVAGQAFTVIENDGSEAIIGTFHNLPQGATIGNFLNSGLPATISYTGGSGNDVVLTVGTIAPANIYTVDNLVDENDGVYTAGRLSLREAITLANASSGADLIKFNTSFASGPGLLTIQLVNALPAITGTVIIDGTSQPGYQGTPLINIHGNSLAQFGLDISNAANVGTVVKGLKFSGIRDTIIRVNNVDMVRLEDLDLSDAPNIPNPTNYTAVGISAENGSDNIVISGVNASGMYLGGIRISNSNSPTIKNNVLKSADVSSNGAIYLSSVYAIGVGAVSGNQFAGSSYGLRIENGMSGLLIGDESVTGANIVIEDGTSGMTSVTSRALYLNNVDYVTIDNVDFSYELPARSGEAVRAVSNSDYLTVRNSNLANRVNGVYVTGGTRDLIVTNNNFTNNTQAIDATNLVRAQQAAAILATGNIFTNSFNVFNLDTMTGSSSGLTIGTSGTNIVLDAASGITSATGTILDLKNVDNVTVTGVNMGYTGASRAGKGIIAVGSDYLSITGSTISNRNNGIQITGGTDPVISNNNLSNDFASLVIDGAIDGADADTAPVLISGNTFTDSFDALQLYNMSGISIGTSGLKSVLVNPAVDGLKTATGTIFNLHSLIGLTIDGMDLSYTGAARTGTGLNISGAGSQLVLQNFTIKNRNVGINVTAASNAEDLTVKNNDLSNNNSTLYIDGFRDGGDADTYPVNLSGNKFSGAGNAMRLWNMDGLTFGITGTEAVVINNATDGLQSATGTVIYLSSAADVTMIGLDLSFPGAGQSGTAIYSDGTMNRLTIKNVSAKNRNNGFRIGDAGQDLTLIDNDLSNNDNALYISGFTDGVDADLVPVVATGTKFTGSTGQTLQIYNLTGQYIGTSASIPGIIINNATDGLNSSSFVALHVYNLPNSTIDGLNLSYPGIGRSGFGIFQDGDFGSGVTIQNVSATNRSNGFFLNGGGTDLTLINNDLSNNENPLRISSYRDGADANLVPVVATGTKFSGSTGQSLQIYHTANQYIGTSALTPGIIINNATDGLNDTGYIALHAVNIPGSTIDGLNLAYTGSLRSDGYGLIADEYLGANVTIQNVIATNRRFGFDMFGGGQDLTLINNDVSNNDLGMRIWDFTDGVDADTVPIIASGNQFANNLNAIDMFNVGGQFFGTAGTGFIISNTAGGLNTVTGSPLTIRGIMENTTIDGLDLSYSGSSASGNGIYYDGSRGNLGANFTIKNVIARNRSTGLNLSPTTGFFGTDLTLINNDVSNSTTGMRLYGFQDGGDSDTQPIIASSNVFTNNQTGLEIYNSPNQYIGTAGTGFIVSNSASGLNTVTGTALNILGLMQNSKIDGLDLSYNGTSRSGSGIKYDGAVNYLGENVTIQNVIARNRDIGINLSPTTGYYGTDLTLINNDVSNSNTGMRLHSFQDGSDADTVPIVASGNIFNNDGTGMYLSSMSGQFIGTSGTGIIFDNNTSGLKSVTGTALVLNTLVSVTVDGLDVSWNGSATHTGQGIYSTDSNNVTVTRVTASNRNEGVRIDGGNLLNINNSTFSNNTTGVTSNNVGTSSLINNNTIQANTNGVSQSGVVQVNGTSNYWGSASAPALNGSNGYTGDVNVGLNLPIAPAGAPSVPAYPPGNVVSFATTANPLEVTTNNDLVSADGYTSLREAIIAANVSGGNITFLAGLNAQTIRLTSPLPPITKQVAIDGGGLITIDGQFNSGDVFFVNGATASNSSIRGLKIKGYASNGFGIRVNGATGVTLQNLDLSDPAGNFVPTGTGIQVENTSSDVTINNVNVSRTTNGIVVSLSDTPKVSNVNASFTGNGVQVTQSASPTITNVNASSTTNGIRVITSANATVRDNTLNNSDLSLYLNGSTGLAVGAIRGNTFSGSSQAVRIDDGQSGLIIGNASLSGTAHVVIEDGTSGMSTVTSRAIYLRGGSANATIDSLQLGFTAGRSGEGIRVDGGGLFLTIRNSNVSGRTNGVTVTAGMNLTLTGNNLSNNGQSVNVSGVKRQAIAPAAAAVTASGNIFTNSANAIAIFGLTAANAGLTIGTTGTENIVINNASSGLQSVTGTAILLSNVDNVAINGIDLSYNGLNGLPRSGTGISGTATPGSTSWTVTNVNASNRTTGISVNGGNDLTLTGNTLVNDGQAISIADVTKLGPASKAVFASGNIFTKSLNALAISNLTGANAGLTIGTTGSENIVINNASSGLQSVTGTAINLSDVDNVTIVNVDVGFTGGSRLGSAIAGSATSNSSFWTIQNVNASNRVSGISISGGKNVTLIGNDLSNNGQSINVSSVTKLAPAVSAVIASGNTFTNSTDAIAISTLNNSDLTIGTTGSENIVINNATAGLQSVVGTAISLNSVGNVTISGVDLGYTGGFRSGAGIKINAGPDSRSTIQNVNASNRFTGIQVTGGKDLTANNNTLTNDGIALFVDSVTKSSLAASVIASGNTFANSGTALQLWNLSSGLTIGTANGSNIKIDNVNSGLQSNTGRVIYLSNISDVNIDGLDVGFNGSVRSGTGIYVDGTNNNNMVVNLVTATNRSTGLRLGDAGQDLTVTNNNLSNNGLALYINNFSDGPDAGKTDNTVPVIATGNTFTGSTSGIELYNMTNQVVATTGTGIIVANTDGLKDSTATALRLSNMNGLTVSSLDLSYSGAGRSGTGIYADGTNHNLTITGVNATRRNRGFRIGDAGQDLILTNNDLSNTNYGLFIRGYYDGDDADTVPVVASGNKFFGVITEALVVHNMSGLYIGTTGTGFIINNATDGLNSTPGVALRIHNIPYSTIDGIDLSYPGTKRSGYGIRAIEDFSDSDYLGGFIRIIGRNVTIQNVIATNRDYGINLVGGGVVGGGDDLKLLNNNLSNNGTSLGLRALTDGDDADNAPFSGTGNKFTGSTNGIFLEGMRNDSLVFGNSIAPGVNFVIDGNSGLTSVSGDALYLFNVNNVTIDGVDLSYRGFRRSGTGIRANDSFVNNLTLKNVTITNRITGLTYNPNTNSAEYLLKIQDSNFLNNDTAIIAAQYNAGGYIRNSRIEGNDTGLVYSTDSSNPTYSIVLDAKGNYWGPGGGGAAGVNNNNGFTSNPADKVDSSGYVATIPAVLNRDYGDAPIAFAFSTSLAGFGARHIATGPMLGTIRDTEPDVTGSTLSNADNITATNDEDGVTVGILTPGANATATVFVTSSGAAKLDAWIDFNRDGDWDDTGEKIANSVSVVNGPNTLTFAVPGSASISLNYSRFRISTAGGLDTFGEAVDGEVEDYVVGNIYVDDNWTNNANFPVGTVITDSDPIMAGDQWGIMGLNAFSTVNGGLAAAAAGTQNQVIVNSGNYSTENANVTKAGLVVIFQEGASTLGSLDDTVSTAIVNLAGITLTTGGTNLATRFDSSIVGNGNLIKAGSGKMTLAGNNTFTGNTTINGGTLALASSSNNNIASSPIITVGSGTILEVAGLSGTELQLASGQTLSGTGTVNGGMVKALSSSTIDPAGSSTGILNTQSVVFASGSTFNVQVNGTTLAGTDYDQLNVTGAVNLGNATLNAAGIVTSEGVPIVLINNDGNDTVIGTFNGLAEKANVTINGKRFVVTYQGGSNNNDVVLLSPTPINTIPGNQTVDEDVSLAFVAGVNGISVLDYDDNLSTTKLTVINGKLTIGSLAGGASISAGANNSSTLTLSGTQTQINAALATLSYKGNQDYNGSDSLVVVSTDAQNNVDTDTISISITPVNDAPVAVNDGTALAPFGVVPKGGSLSTGTGVLNNDSDVDVGDVLTAELFTNVLHGSLTLNANGSFNYRPTSNYSGPDSFTYRAKDIAGLYSNVATVFLNVVNDAPTDILLSNNIVTENSNTAVDLAIGNLTSVDANVGDSAGFTLLAGLDEALFLISGSTLKLKAGVSVDFETRPSYRVNVRVTDGSGATFDKELTIFVRDLAEVASIQLNDGAVQRSVLTKLVVTFDTAVSIDSPGAFAVRNRNTNTFAAIRIATATNSSGKTAATITFASGANVNNRASANSLVDGNYELQIYGSLITSIATGLKVDAAKTGNSSGSNDVFGDQAIDRFFRLFGDIDGDRDVDALDNAQFKPTLNSTLVAKPTIYKAEFDFDGDGDIDALDNLRFRQNLNKTMPAI